MFRMFDKVPMGHPQFRKLLTRGADGLDNFFSYLLFGMIIHVGKLWKTPRKTVVSWGFVMVLWEFYGIDHD